MIGEFDTSVGGISGSTLDAASFLDTYSSDNRSGFTINWGFDSSVADIEVIYYDYEGNRHREMWAYDSICSALNGEIFLIDGEEAVVPAAKDIEVTPTTVAFTIDQFNNAAYNNITYSLQYYDLADGVYYDAVGFVDLVPTSEDVLVEGLTPFFYGSDETGTTIYQGDYQIVVNFGYVLDAEKEGQTISSWFEMGQLITVNGDAPTATGNVIDLTVNVEDDAARAIASIAVYTAGAVDAAAAVDFSDLSAVTVTGLTADADYTLMITFNDGEVAYYSFNASVPAAE
jgi:hypothetical protein